MAQIKETGFFPGQRYRVQVRAKSKSDPNVVSDWSNILTFTTSADTIPPKPPSDLVLTPEGTSFIAKWKKPTQNINNTVCTDLRGFFVSFHNTDDPDEETREVFTADESFTLDFDTNQEMFGVPRGKLTIKVSSVDHMGNRSEPATASAENPRPANVEGLVVTNALESLAINWDANTTDSDLAGYEVHSSTSGPDYVPGPDTRRYFGMGTSFILSASNPVVHYIKVRAVDVFGLYSEEDALAEGMPKTTTGMDNTPPGVPTSFEVANFGGGNLATVKATWVAPLDSDLDHYVLRYGKSTVDWSYINIPADAEEAIVNNLDPGEDYFFGIKAVDHSSNSSQWANASEYPFQTQIDTTPPNKPSAPAVYASPSGMVAVAHSMRDVSDNIMERIDQLEIHMSFTEEVSPGELTRVSEITVAGYTDYVSALVTMPVREDDHELYWWVVAQDRSGNRSEPSDAVMAVPGLIEGAYIADATINDAKIQNLSAAKLNAGSAFINDLFIRSKLEIDNDFGLIQSSTYSAQNNTGWKIDRNGITINEGVIRGQAIELQSSPNIAPTQFSDFEFNREFYCNPNTNVPTNELTPPNATMRVNTHATAKFGNQSLRFWDGAGTSNRKLTLSRPGVFNVEIAGGQTYIASLYVKNNLGAARSVRLEMESQSGEVFSSSTVATPANSDWIRVSVAGEFSFAASSIRVSVVAIQTVDIDFLIDGLQIERKTGVLTDPSPWSPNGMTIIDGGAITTGSIRSSAPAAGIPTQPAWSLNTQGNLQVGDALVRGRLLVGAGSDLSNSLVQSTDYSPGSSGWVIRGDGTVEFNNGVFRGQLGAETVTADSLASNLVLTNRIIAGALNGPRVEMKGGTGDDTGLIAYSNATTRSLHINTNGNLTSYDSLGRRTIEMDTAGNLRTFNPATGTSVFALENNGSVRISNPTGDTFHADPQGNLTVMGKIATSHSGPRIEIEPHVGITFYANDFIVPGIVTRTRWNHSVFVDHDGWSKSGFYMDTSSIQALKTVSSNDNRYFYGAMTMADNRTEMWSFRVYEESNSREHTRLILRARDFEVVAGPTVNAEKQDPAYVQNNWAPMLFMPWGGHAGFNTPGKPIILLSHLRNGNAPLHRSGFQGSVRPDAASVIYSHDGLVLRNFSNEWYTTLTAGDINGGVITYNLLVPNVSGVQFKENFTELPDSGLSVLRGAPVSMWNYKENPNQTRVGIVATDLPDWLTVPATKLITEETPAGEITETSVRAEKHANSSYELTALIGVLWQAVRELDEELDEFRAQSRSPQGMKGTSSAVVERRYTHKPAEEKEVWIESLTKATDTYLK